MQMTKSNSISKRIFAQPQTTSTHNWSVPRATWVLLIVASVVLAGNAESRAVAQAPAANGTTSKASVSEAASAPATPGASTATVATPEDPRRISAKVVRYAQRLVHSYDRDGDGQLGQQEIQAMRGAARQADLNHDGVITVEELTRFIADYGQNRRIRLLPPQPGDLVEMPPLLNPTTGQAAAPAAKAGAGTPPAAASPAPAEAPAPAPEAAKPRESKFYVQPARLPAGLPDWFLARDLDGDGQVTISEFSPKNIPAELQQFKQLDRDGDGVITPAECIPQGSSEVKKSTKAGK